MASEADPQYSFDMMLRIVIQDSHSFCYLQESGAWGYNPIAARRFTRVQEAAEHCAATGLNDAYIVMGVLRPDGRFDSASKSFLRLPSVHLRGVVKSVRSRAE